MYSACKLNKQGDYIQSWCTLFPISNQSLVSCLVLTVASWPTYRFLRRQVRWSGIPISLRVLQFIVIHTVKGFSIVNEAEVDVFLEFPCFLYDPVDVGNLISVSSAFSKSSLYIWKFSVHIVLKHRILSITLIACEMSATYGSLNIVWHCPSLGLEWKLTFSGPVARAEFPKFAGILSALSQHHLLGFSIT